MELRASGPLPTHLVWLQDPEFTLAICTVYLSPVLSLVVCVRVCVVYNLAGLEALK